MLNITLDEPIDEPLDEPVVEQTMDMDELLDAIENKLQTQMVGGGCTYTPYVAQRVEREIVYGTQGT